MISISHLGALYVAVLSTCFDDDTCTVTFPNFPPLVAEQSLRFDGFDTPEMRGGCARSKKLARQAQAVTEDYMRGNVRLEALGGEKSLGRLVVRAPDLQSRIIERGLAKLAPDKKRQKWCD